MEEKKLTDDEIVKAFENCEDLVTCDGCPLRQPGCIVLALDLIHRLQDDYSKLKERYVKVLDLNEKVIAEQKTKIERLTKEKTESAKTAVEILEQNIELQKQVDELKTEVKLEKEWGDIKVVQALADFKIWKQQTVTDTAKEICLKIIKGQPQPIKEKWVEWFKKEYGVEVE